MSIGNTLTISKSQRFDLSFTQNLIDDVIGSILKELSHLNVRSSLPLRITAHVTQRSSMRVIDFQKTIEVFVFLGSSLNGKEIDDLNKQQRFSITRFFNNLN